MKFHRSAPAAKVRQVCALLIVAAALGGCGESGSGGSPDPTPTGAARQPSPTAAPVPEAQLKSALDRASTEMIGRAPDDVEQADFIAYFRKVEKAEHPGALEVAKHWVRQRNPSEVLRR